jgi:hypothetical protein
MLVAAPYYPFVIHVRSFAIPMSTAKITKWLSPAVAGASTMPICACVLFRYANRRARQFDLPT